MLVGSRNHLRGSEGGQPLLIFSRARPWQRGNGPDGSLVSPGLLLATSAFLLASFLGLSHRATPVPGPPLGWASSAACPFLLNTDFRLRAGNSCLCQLHSSVPKANQITAQMHKYTHICILNTLHTHTYACVLSRFSRVQLFAAPWTEAHQAPLSMGFSREEYCNGLPCPPPGHLPKLGIEPASPTSPSLADGFFTTSTTWEAPDTHMYVCICIYIIPRLSQST